MRDVKLKVDGSNFIYQYQHLIGILISNDLLNVIRELLGDAPDNSVCEKGDDEYHTHGYLFMTVQYDIRYCRESKLRVRVNDTNTYDVVHELKALYCKSELWSMSIWTGFSFNCGGRKHLLRKSLGKMYEIHGHLVYDLDY